MDKNILVIGSSSELAKGTIEELKKFNYNIWATSRHTSVMDEKIKEFYLDVTNETDFIHLSEKFKNVEFDTIVNFSGIAVAGAVEEMNEIQLKKQLDVNLFGLLRIIKYFGSNISKNGKLVNISSMASYGTFPFLSPYCISKSSADILLNSYSIESGVKVVSIRPGAIATKFWDSSIQLNKECFEKTSDKFSAQKEFLINNANKNSLHAANSIHVSKKIASIIRLKNPCVVYNIGNDAKLIKWTRFLPQGLTNNIIKFVLNKRIRRLK